MNLPRLLENWSSTSLTLNTSFVNLFNSIQATAQFRLPGAYYYAPGTRNFNFDGNFLDYRKLPPGTPILVTSGAPAIAAQPQNVMTLPEGTAAFAVSLLTSLQRQE